MVTCGSQYGVFLAGKWQWFSNKAEAMRAEAEALSGKAQQKLAAGGTVILTREMYRQVEAALKSGCNAPQSQNADR